MTEKIILTLFLGILSLTSFAQTDYAGLYGPIKEQRLIESKWRYTYTLHVESNTVIHKAENYYDYFLYLRYDYTYQEYLNGEFSRGTWSLNGRTLFYSFKNIKKFEITELGKNVLVLEFNQPNAKGTYQYHFVRVPSEAAPFVKPANELPDVIVEEIDPRALKRERRWWAFGKKKKKKKKDKYAPTPQLTYINVELIGGGYYGGINPVLRDYIHVKSDGRLIKEHKSVKNGLQITKKNIPREELEEFADWVTRQGFFEMERMYDCETPICQKRKRQKPTPVPLRLAVAYGSRKKVITISIWGMDDNQIHYVDYPKELDNIIDAIQRMANRIEDSVARK